VTGPPVGIVSGDRGFRTGVHLDAGIVSDDGAALTEFLVAGLGFTLVSSDEFPQGTVRRLRRDSARCKVFQPAEGAEVQPPPEPWHRYRGFGYAALLVDDARAVVDRAAAHGAEVVTDVVAHRPGAKYALLRDPQGNVWEILQEGEQEGEAGT
jgi:uncharacterized glyoxalase superfamily protein PhnB